MTLGLPLPARGLYVLTLETLAGALLLERVSAALDGGAVLVQYRAKSAADVEQARALAALCHARDVPLVVNDDPVLARAAGADGVHVGADDLACDAAREILGAGAIVGVSCYDSLERAEAAQAAGASYVAFGSFHASPTKPAAVRAPLVLLERARARLSVPIAAIGGITPDNAGPLLAAGADLLAVASAVLGTADPRAAARRFSALFGAGTAVDPGPSRTRADPRGGGRGKGLSGT